MEKGVVDHRSNGVATSGSTQSYVELRPHPLRCVDEGLADAFPLSSPKEGPHEAPAILGAPFYYSMYLLNSEREQLTKLLRSSLIYTSQARLVITAWASLASSISRGDPTTSWLS